MIRVRLVCIGFLMVAVLACISQVAVAASSEVTIETDSTGEPISKYVYGQFIEHQGRCIYGGIWAEMLEDRKFFYPINFYFPWGEDKHKSPWKPIGFDTVVVTDRNDAYVGEHTPRIDLDGRKPRGIMQDSLALQKGREYEGRIILAGEGSVKVKVSLVWGPRSDDKQTITISNLTNEYKKTPLNFTAGVDNDYGHLEIVGQGTGSFRIGTVSLMPADNIHGMRADTIKLLRELNATVYRWPGGLFVNDYDWRAAIGDRDKRPPRENRAYWSADVETNDFGLDEFMALCQTLDAEPYVVVSSTGPGDARSAAEEVEYLNGAPDTPMGQLRAANGHPKPYTVKWWGIGNEMWGFMPLDRYVHRHNHIAEAMRQVDPSIKLIAVGGLGVGEEWTPVMLEHCNEYMDLISEHFYASGEGPARTIAEHVRRMPEGIRGIPEAHRAFRRDMEWLRGKDIRVALDEWNYFWYSPQIYGEAGPRYYLREALGIAAGLHELFRNSDIIFMANTHPVNVHGHVKTNKTDAAFETTGLVLKLYRERFGNVPVAVTGHAEPLDVVAAWTDDRTALTIGIVNPTEREHNLTIGLDKARPARGGQCWTISHPDPMAYNEPARDDQVVIEQNPLRDISNGLVVPPFSINLCRVPVR